MERPKSLLTSGEAGAYALALTREGLEGIQRGKEDSFTVSLQLVGRER